MIDQPMTHRFEQPTARKVNYLFLSLIGLLVASVILLAGQILHIVAGSMGGGPYDGWIQIIPWLIPVVILTSALIARAKMQLGLASAGVVLLLHNALPNLYLWLPGASNWSHLVWIDSSGDTDIVWLRAIAEETLVAVWVGDLLLWFGALAVLVATVFLALSLRGLLLAPAQKASFTIDMTFLTTLLFVAVLTSATNRIFGSFFTSELFGSDLFTTQVWFMVWAIPLIIWVALAMRQGGITAIGSASGLVATFLVIPNLMNFLSDLFPEGSSANYVYLYDGSQTEVNPAGQAYDAFNPFGFNASAAGVSALILLVALWWSLGSFADAKTTKSLATTSSPVNSLSVLAFSLSWLPLTSIPANILGHMSYDQVISGDEPQRGIGLARWAIVISYVSLVAGAFFINNTWFE
jgi:hypothetical protein